MRSRSRPELADWPSGTAPTDADVFAHNERLVAAPPAQVWPWLVDAAAWPAWYRNAWRVRLPPGTAALRLGVTFTWTTFGTRITAAVVHEEAERRLGWTWWCRGASGYHGWLLEPVAGGTRVVTEESQHGPRVVPLAPLLRRVLPLGHAYWLRALDRQVRLAGARTSPGAAGTLTALSERARDEHSSVDREGEP